MSESEPRQPDWRLILAVAIAILAWSAAWVSIRKAVEHYPPGQLALGRYLVASTALAVVWLARGRKLPPAKDLPWLLLMGILGFTLYNLAINDGERTITAGAAAFIASTIPIFSTLGAWLFLRQPVTRRFWCGSLVSLFGVLIISLSSKGGIGLSPGALLVVGASLCAAGYGVVSKRLLARHAALEVTTWAIWCGTLALVPFGMGLGHTVRTAPLESTANLVFLGLFPGALGYVLWSYALSKMTLSNLTSFLYLVPAFSVLMAWAYLGELPQGQALAGGVITLIGVAWANRPAGSSPANSGK